MTQPGSNQVTSYAYNPDGTPVQILAVGTQGEGITGDLGIDMYFEGLRDAPRFLVEFALSVPRAWFCVVTMILDFIPWFMLQGAAALGAGFLISRRTEHQMPSLIEAGRTSSIFAGRGRAQQRYFGKTAFREAMYLSQAGPFLTGATHISRLLIFAAPVLIVLAVVFDWGGS